MSVDRTYYCDGPDCGDKPDGPSVHCQTATPPPHLPVGFMELRGDRAGIDPEGLHFCGWDCLMKYAAQHPPEEPVEIEGL